MSTTIVPTNHLTATDWAIWEAMRAYQAEWHRPATIRGLALFVHRARNVVWEHIQRLAHHGYVQKLTRPGQARSGCCYRAIRPIPPREQWPFGGDGVVRAYWNATETQLCCELA